MTPPGTDTPDAAGDPPPFLDPGLRRARTISMIIVAVLIFVFAASRHGHPWALAALITLGYLAAGIAFFSYLERRALRRWKETPGE